jgi:putative hydrolase of the HAD superfamily
MIDAGLNVKKEEMVEKIFKVYWQEGIEDQNIFDKVLIKEFGQIDYKLLAAGIIGYKKAKEGHMTLYPHVRLTLTELMKMGIRMGVVSDAPRLPVWLRIVGLNLHHYFEQVVSFDDTGERKPSPKPFKKILDLMQLEPKECIMVGDWAERDIVGAKNTGMLTAWAKYGNQFDTKVSGADYEIDDIYQLIEIIKAHNN